MPGAVSVLNPFQILLNDLSNELHEKNLHSLIHVCGDLIPTGQREKISSGWEAFSILRQLNVIGSEPEKMANLLAIIKELRPRRKDLVLKIERHIQNNYEDPDLDLILKDLESSSDFALRFQAISRSSTPVSQIPQEDCCRIRCCGLACIYNPCCDACCCCVILALLFFFLAIIAALAWYSNCIPVVSKYLKSQDDTTTARPFVISILAFLAVCSVISGIYMRYCRPAQLNYAMLRNAAAHEIRSEQPSYASSDSVPTSYNSAMGRRIERPRRECSCSSGQYTASSSVTSRASMRYPRLPDDVVPDCFPPDDYTEVIIQDVEEREGDLAEF